MKMKHALLIFLSGFIVTALGALFKLESWEYASELLIVGLSLKFTGGILMLYKLLTHPKVKEFLNH
jgi:hypothetical protein